MTIEQHLGVVFGDRATPKRRYWTCGAWVWPTGTSVLRCISRTAKYFRRTRTPAHGIEKGIAIPLAAGRSHLVAGTERALCL